MGLTKPETVSLAWHSLYIAAIILVGLVLSGVVAGLVAPFEFLRGFGDLLAETVRLTAIVTAVLYAVRAA